MSTTSNSQSVSLPLSESSWWSPSSWVPDATDDSASTLSTSTFSPDWSSESGPPTVSWTSTWIETDLPTATRVTSAGPPSTTPTFTFSALSSSPTPLIETPTRQIDSIGQNPKGTTAKLRTGHIVAISVVTFVVLSAMASLVIFLLIRRIRRLGLYKNLDDDSSTTFLKNTGRTGDGEASDLSAAGGIRGRKDTIRPHTPSRVLDRWYHNGRRTLSDGETTPILQPSLSQSDIPASASPTERQTSSFGLIIEHESPTVQYRSLPSVEDPYGPLSPLDPPRYSQIPPMRPTVRPPRPLPVPRNPRNLTPQRRVDSVQVRKQNKPPLLSSSTTPPPLPSFLPTLSPSSGLHDISRARGAAPVPENFLPLLPQRGTEPNGTEVLPSPWSLSNSNLTLAPLRPTPPPTVSFKHRTSVSTNHTTKNSNMP